MWIQCCSDNSQWSVSCTELGCLLSRTEAVLVNDQCRSKYALCGVPHVDQNLADTFWLAKVVIAGTRHYADAKL